MLARISNHNKVIVHGVGSEAELIAADVEEVPSGVGEDGGEGGFELGDTGEGHYKNE